MKKNYWAIVKRVVDEADIVIEIVDARFPEQSRNEQVERMVDEKGKKLLIVINKADLVEKGDAEKTKETLGVKSVFVSAKQKKGATKLREALGKMSEKKESKVALIGYPNTGKSSVINMLKGKKSAKTSSTAGFTRGMQYVRISSRIMLIDTPGIIPLDEKDETLMVLLSAKNIQQVKDLEGTGIEIVQALLKNNGETVRKFYGADSEDAEEFLEELALKRNKLLKKGKPDLREAARVFIRDFQEGKIGLKKTKTKG